MIAYALAGLWAAGCLVALLFLLGMVVDDGPGPMLLVFLIGGPLLAVLGWLPWRMLDEATAPSFALQKAEWTCTISHTESTSSAVMVGKMPVVTNSLNTVCDQWSRK